MSVWFKDRTMKVRRRHHGLAGLKLLAVTVMTLAAFSLAVISVTGCEPGSQTSEQIADTQADKQVEPSGEEEAQFGIELEGVEGGFFDDEFLLEGAVDIAAEEKEVACVGEGRDVRGIVLAPHAQMAMKWQFPDWLVATAEASPLEGELPVGDVAVRLYQVDRKGVQVGEDFASTRTSSG